MFDVSCGPFRVHLMEMARGARLDDGDQRRLAAHLKACAQCAREFDEQTALTAALRNLAEETGVAAAETLPTRLLAELEAANHARQRVKLRWMPIAAGLMAASVLTGWLLIHSRPSPPQTAKRVVKPVEVARPLEKVAQVTAPPSMPRRAKPHRRRARSAAPNSWESQPFYAIPYTVPLAPEERAEVVRMDLPVAAVIATGIRVKSMDPGGHAEADVLVGQDGRARAIRLISISTNVDRRPNQ